MILKKQLVKREIAGDVLLVPIGESALDLKGLLTLNETAARLWELLPQCASEDELVQTMRSEYEVEESQLRADVAEFLAQLRALSIL